ncbi:hypothetical protein T439DRAFT_321673 [Meredithblackwellia eburnea MCA 4105]
MAARYSAPVKSQLFLGPLTIPKVLKWSPILALWGGAAVGAGALFLSPIPRFQRDVLQKIPGIAGYFTDKTPDSDKPF